LRQDMDNDALAENAYTDSPRLRPNLILGSLQLLWWFLLHPSAWRNYIAQIDPGLRSDFCLAELNQTQWRVPDLQRLLAIKYIVWPLMAGIVVGLVSVIGGASRENVMLGIAAGIGVGVGVSVGVSVAGNAAAGALTGTLETGVAIAVGMGENGRITFTVLVAVTLIVLFGTSIGASSSVAGGLVSQRTGYSPARLLSGVAIGVIISIVAVLVAVVVVGDMPVGIAGGLALGVAVGWRTRSWHRGVLFGGTWHRKRRVGQCSLCCTLYGRRADRRSLGWGNSWCARIGGSGSPGSLWPGALIRLDARHHYPVPCHRSSRVDTTLVAAHGVLSIRSDV
jgi:hypothetical protein